MNIALNNEEDVFYCYETEEAVLGALILEPNQYENVANLLRPDLFAREAHQIVFAAIQELYMNDKPADMVVLTEYLISKNELKKVGGAVFIAHLTSKMASAANIEYYARIIVDYACRRRIYMQLLKIGQHVTDKTYKLDEVISEVSNFMDNTVNDVFGESRISTFGEHLINYSSNAGTLPSKNYLTPYIESIRNYIPTWKDGELIIVAGRPGMGKTAFVLHELFQQSKLGNSILFYSLEMGAEDLVNRILAIESEINSNRIEYYDLSSDDWTKLDVHIGKIENIDFYIDDQPHMTLDYLLTQSKIYKKKYDIRALAIDYLQLIELPSNETRALAIAICTRKLKVLSRILDIPIFLICQLNREVEQRGVKSIEPQLSHLRESGAIEQDADKVLFPLRLSYYYPDDPGSFGKGYIKIAKNRKGKVGKPLVSISSDVTRWSHREGKEDVF